MCCPTLHVDDDVDAGVEVIIPSMQREAVDRMDALMREVGSWGQNWGQAALPPVGAAPNSKIVYVKSGDPT